MSEKMRTVYLETTIVSYLTGRPSRDLIIAARQELTHEWWENHRNRFKLVVSPIVLAEVGRGDPEMVAKRTEVLSDLEILPAEPPIELLAARVAKALNIPATKVGDAFHLAYSIHHSIDFLATWNCAHFENPDTRRRLDEFARTSGAWSPVICTPEDLLEWEDANE